MKLKHEISTPALHPSVSSCVSACTFELKLCIAISSASPSAHVVFVCKTVSQWDGMLASTSPLPPTLHAPLGLPLCGPLLPFTSHSSLYVSVHCSLWLSRRIDTKSAGSQCASRQNNTKIDTLLERQTLKQAQDSWTKWEPRS